METRRERDTVFVKLSDGEDLFPSLEAAARVPHVESGTVMWGIGMLRDFEIGFFGPKGYDKTVFSARHELLGLHGRISLRGVPLLHLLVTLGRPNPAPIAGHLCQ